MATTKREDASAASSAEIGEAKRRSALDLNERAAASELLTEEALTRRQEAISRKRKPAGPELEAPAATLGQEALRRGETGAEAVPETELEEAEDLTAPDARPEPTAN